MATGHRPPAAGEPAWTTVSPARPCSCCGADDDCSAAEDGGFVRCRTIVSSRPIVGGGWLHEATEDSARDAGVVSVAASAEQA